MGRSSGMSGPQPISMTEIDAWQRVRRVCLTPWELDMIKVFDAITLDTAMKDQS